MATGGLLLALVLAISAAAAADTADSEELPKPAAHKQIIYRYIPIDKAFLGYDQVYDDYYKTQDDNSDDRYYNYDSPSSDRRDDHAGYRRQDYDSHSRQDYTSYSRNDFDNYRKHDYDTNSRSDYDSYSRDDHDSYSRDDHDSYNRNDVDSYSSYRPGYNRRQEASSYQEDDSAEEYATTRRPARRRKKKNKNRSGQGGTRSKVMDFAEALFSRIMPRMSSYGGGGGHKGNKGSKGSKFKYPKLSFDAVVKFLSYVFAVFLVLGYAALVALNAASSDGNNLASLLSRSLESDHAELINAEAVRLLTVLENAIAQQENDCLSLRLCQFRQISTSQSLRTITESALAWVSGEGGPAARESRSSADWEKQSCDTLFPKCVQKERAAAESPLL